MLRVDAQIITVAENLGRVLIRVKKITKDDRICPIQRIMLISSESKNTISFYIHENNKVEEDTYYQIPIEYDSREFIFQEKVEPKPKVYDDVCVRAIILIEYIQFVKFDLDGYPETREEICKSEKNPISVEFTVSLPILESHAAFPKSDFSGPFIKFIAFRFREITIDNRPSIPI